MTLDEFVDLLRRANDAAPVAWTAKDGTPIRGRSPISISDSGECWFAARQFLSVDAAVKFLQGMAGEPVEEVSCYGIS